MTPSYSEAPHSNSTNTTTTTTTRFAELYESVDDVDLFVAASAERPAHGALVGATFACILERQFERVAIIDLAQAMKIMLQRIFFLAQPK